MKICETDLGDHLESEGVPSFDWRHTENKDAYIMSWGYCTCAKYAPYNSNFISLERRPTSEIFDIPKQTPKGPHDDVVSPPFLLKFFHAAIQPEKKTFD
jgi:hypothetical protein